MTQDAIDILVKPCPCGSGAAYGDCCGPYHKREAPPQTAEQLMRSRYSAFALQKIDYLRDTLWPKYQPGFDAFATAKWAAENHWSGLTILKSEKGGAADNRVRYYSRPAILLAANCTPTAKTACSAKKACAGSIWKPSRNK